ncbi:MAG: DUF962 domain-containing protein [Planctomycetales bacterium]|nr:DUF962 domain-containing protein [Planctomycetales bacterium]
MPNRKSIQTWFDEYSEYHKNATNKVIHWICIPLITFSLLGLLWEIPLPMSIASVSPWLNVATLFFVASLIFYFRLSIPIAAGMALTAFIMLVMIATWDQRMPESLWKVCTAIFVVAWIGQFIGHKVEGRKPAFIEDLQFLLIGPAWLLGFVYQRLGIRY